MVGIEALSLLIPLDLSQSSISGIQSQMPENVGHNFCKLLSHQNNNLKKKNLTFYSSGFVISYPSFFFPMIIIEVS